MTPCLLIIEDHDGLRSELAELLTSAGYAVTATRNGEEAHAALASMPRPCLVLWDPVRDPMDSPLAVDTFGGIHIATIPVSIAPATPGAALGFTKRLTSREVVLHVVRDHCGDAGDLRFPL
jgi:CheY-like chemotaxis protein